MLNVLTITGRLVDNPTLRHTNSNVPVTSYRIAVKRDYVVKDDDDTDFFDVVAWRTTAEFVCEHFGKGSLMQIVGRIENRKWEDKHNQPRVTTEIKAEKVYFGESKGKDSNTGDFDPFDGGKATAKASPQSGFDPFG